MMHTAEPWESREVDGLVAIAHKGGFILEADDDRQNITDARRIVACVNACAGMITEGLETFNVKKEMRELAEERETYRMERDDLLEIIRDIVVGRDKGKWLVLVDISMLRAAIEQIEAAR